MIQEASRSKVTAVAGVTSSAKLTFTSRRRTTVHRTARRYAAGLAFLLIVVLRKHVMSSFVVARHVTGDRLWCYCVCHRRQSQAQGICIESKHGMLQIVRAGTHSFVSFVEYPVPLEFCYAITTISRILSFS